MSKQAERPSANDTTDLVTSQLGEALISDEVITREQLSRALKVQRYMEQPRQLGELLVELGFATRQSITEAIANHGPKMRLGEILIEQGLLTREELQIALTAQKESKRPLGQTLIDLGFINELTLLRNLAHQSGVPYIEPSFAIVERALLAGLSPDFLEQRMFIPVCKREDGKILVVVNELRDEETLRALQEMYHDNFTLALGPAEAIRSTAGEVRSYRTEHKRKSQTGEADEDGVVSLVEHIFMQAIKEKASDIHIEPERNKIRLRYRIDGVLVFKTELPIELHPKLASRIKIMAECDIAERRLHQGGRIIFEHEGSEYDLRLSSYVTLHGECLVLRVLNKQVGLVSLEELGMCPTMLGRYRLEVLEPPTGVVIITGPTGSGKTTTLYSSIDYCNEMDRKIITVEDPVEFVIPGIIQCSVQQKIGRTFENSLREVVRQDPDIIVLGEIRDRITAETAIEAALTGHKVYSTFHTEDTIGGLVRLLNMQIEAFLISSTVISVLAQRLLRRICHSCETPHVPDPTLVRRLGLDLKQVREFEYKKGQGCAQCNFTGYRGRIGAYELLVLNDLVKEAVLDQKPAHVIRQISTDSTGLISMREDAVSKVIRGHTTFEEVLRHTPQTTTMRPLPQIMTMTQ